MLDPFNRKSAAAAPNLPRIRLLCLDFDGVLHPSVEVADFPTAGLPLLAYIQSRPHLLRWAGLLHAAMADSDCDLIVHSSWRKEVLDSDLRRLLEPSGLAERLVGSTPRHMAREASILEVAGIMGVAQNELLVLDDAIHEFDLLVPQLVACDPLRGLSDESVLTQIRERLRAGRAATTSSV
ncbi:MAG: HAD domain-containing protein [Betaproteobacteria bacterium]